MGGNLTAGQTFYLRIYPYYLPGTIPGGVSTGKWLMLANVVIAGVTRP